jgi:uncharacterized phage-associated protein
MQVLKLVYYCHAWMLGVYSRPLVRQPIEAWRYGPVVRELYRSIREYGGDPIRCSLMVRRMKTTTAKSSRLLIRSGSNMGR